MSLWAMEWHSINKLDGERRYIMRGLFKTRSACRAYIEQHYGYIRNRQDLRTEPHGWRLPQPTRVTVTKVSR